MPDDDAAAIAEKVLEDIEGLRQSSVFASLHHHRHDDAAVAAPEFGLGKAYRVQACARSLRELRGEKCVGYKVGCTSAAVRERLGLTSVEAIRGLLWSSEQIRPDPVGVVAVNESSFRRLAIEGELAVTLISTDSSDVSDWVVDLEAIIELHHSALDGPPRVRAAEIICKNGIHAGVVRGRNVRRTRLGDVSLTSPLVTTIDGRQIDCAAGLSSLEINGIRGPVGTVSWLRSQPGVSLGPGLTILTATPGNLVAVGEESGNIGLLKAQFEDLVAECRIEPATPGDTPSAE